MMSHCRRSGFSLAELLVALSVLSVVAAVIVPKFLALQAQAKSVVAGEITKELNVTYANWKSSGGGVSGSGSVGSLILSALTSPSGSAQAVTSADKSAAVTQTGLAPNIRISLPDGAPSSATLAAISTDAVRTTDYLIFYSASNDSFSAVPGNLAWTPAGWSADTVTVPRNWVSPVDGSTNLGTYTVQKNGLVFGVLTSASTSGSLYAADPATGDTYRADYVKNPTGSLVKPSPGIYLAMAGYAPYRFMGVSIGGGYVPQPTWTITYSVGR